MVTFRNYLISLIPLLIFSLIYPDHSIIEDTRVENLISWGIILIWWSYIVIFLGRIKRAHEYHSSLNSAFFIGGSLFIAIFSAFWGDYTTLFLEPEYIESGIYRNAWLIVISFPFTIWGMFLLFFTFSRYYAVYLGTKVLDARKYGLFTAFFNIIFVIIFIFNPQIFFDWFNVTFYRNHSSLNGILLLHLIFQSIAFLFGFLKKRPNIGHLSSQRVATRINRMDESLGQSTPTHHSRPSNTVITSSPTYSSADPNQPRPVQSATRTSSNQNINRQQQTRDQQRNEQARREQIRRDQQRRDAERKEQLRREQEHQERERRERQRKEAASRQAASSSSKLASTNLQALRPKTGVLTPDDFKCIFCFRTPKLPEDQHRDIVVCPNCHYPAHIDEFLGWSRNSQFCSRCEGQLPTRFKMNPDKVSTATYLNAMKQLLKKK